MITKDRNADNEYVTKGTMKEEFNAFRIEMRKDIHEIVNQAIDNLGKMLEKNFTNMYQRLNTIESTMATKQDILNVLDRTTTQHQHNELKARVVLLEEKVN